MKRQMRTTAQGDGEGGTRGGVTLLGGGVDLPGGGEGGTWGRVTPPPGPSLSSDCPARRGREGPGVSPCSGEGSPGQGEERGGPGGGVDLPGQSTTVDCQRFLAP
ncbi:unnamed protein product [Gadus morhua 'NCC']